MANKQTIKPKVVPFEIAKLLKEVGYDEKIAEFWAYVRPCQIRLHHYATAELLSCNQFLSCP